MPHYLRLLNNPAIRQGSASLTNHNRSKSSSKTKHQKSNPSNIDGSISVQIKLSCTTDLGDAYYDGDLYIDVRILSSERSIDSVANGSVIWKRGARVLTESVQLQCVTGMDLTKEYWLCLEPRSDEGSLGLSIEVEAATQEPSMKSRRLASCSMPEIGGVLAPVSHPSGSGNGNHINQHVLRRFDIPRIRSLVTGGQNLCSTDEFSELYIFEEMGESIARHIW